MQRSVAFLVLSFLLFGCAPAAGTQAAPAVEPAGASPTVAVVSTPSAAATPTGVASAACADFQEVMDYLDHMGFSDFEQAEPADGLSVLAFSDQDIQLYGQSITVRFTGACVIDIRGVFGSHFPPTDAEKARFALFMTAVSQAGLTVDQRQVLIDWIAAGTTASLLREAQVQGTAARSTTLSPLSPFPSIELQDEVTETAIFTRYHAVFAPLPGE